MSGFTAWRPATPDGFALAAAGPAVVQIKVVGRLLPYPTGQSAMLWYGVLAGCAAEVEGTLAAAARDAPEDVLVWRSLDTPRPSAELATVLGAFVRRFGTPPRLNATGLGPHRHRRPPP